MESDQQGVLTYRVVSCPPGYALIRYVMMSFPTHHDALRDGRAALTAAPCGRVQNNPVADECERCPGTTQYAYNLDGSQWTGEEQAMGLNESCRSCPLPIGGAQCNGGTEVVASPNFWKEEETVTVRRSSRKVFKIYQCDPGLCAGNNTCNGGREGAACGRCPPNHALEAGICRECNITRDPQALSLSRALFGVIGGLIILVVWFLFAWAPVFGGTAQSFFMAWFAW